MEQEEFRAIPGYEGLYEVSNMGRVKSFNYLGCKNKIGILNTKPRFDGYISVGLSKNKIVKTFLVHQLVAMAFLEHKPDKLKIVVDHINEDKSDNRLKNLRLLTNRANLSRKKRDLPTGVCLFKRSNKFYVRIKINGKREYLGSFSTPEEASEAYQKALKQIDI